MPALSRLRHATRSDLAKMLLRGGPETDEARRGLERMALAKPEGLKERAYRRIILAALSS